MRAACLTLGAFLLAGCSGRSGPPVELVVPKGFTGTVWLILDPDGQDIPLVHGQYQMVVPPSGILRIQSFAPLEQWHSFSARYDGTTIPWTTAGTPESRQKWSPSAAVEGE